MDNILFIFSLCRDQSISTRMLVKIKFCCPSKAKIRKGEKIEEPKAETDDFLNNAAKATHTRHIPRPTIMFIPNIMPINVATPFPPLKE